MPRASMLGAAPRSACERVTPSPIMPTLVPRDLDARFANALQVTRLVSTCACYRACHIKHALSRST